VDDKNKRNDKKNKAQIKMIIFVVILTLILTTFVNRCINRYNKGSETEISYDTFVQMLEDKKVKSVTLQDGKYTVVPKKQENPLSKTTYTVTPISDYKLVDRLTDSGAKYSAKSSDGSEAIGNFIVTWVLPFVLLYGFFYLMMRNVGKGGGGVMGVGKSTAKLYVEKKTGVTFADVAGQDEAKESLTEMVDFLHNPEKYLKIGAKLPKGALLVGPPGTGKTLLAKAVAGEADVPFFSLSGSDFVEMFVGVGASRVRDLFKQAQSMAPCIIFIDEIDAIGKSRDTRFGGGNDEREQTLNALLAEMDGFDTSKGLIILAATNRPEVLDKALLRPGRFDRRVVVERPDLKGRIETLKVHAKNVLMDDTVDLKEIALATSGAVGSDLANMVNEAALAAVKAGRHAVSQKDLFEAVEVVIAGKEKKDRIMNDKEKRIVAYHEVGHALVMALQKDSEPVQKITIVPRTMGALGYTMQTPEEEKYLSTKDEMLADLVAFYGGRAAEEIKFDSVTTGASNDIERATSIARSMVTQYGMSDKFGMIGLESISGQYLDGRRVLECSEVTEAEIDKEVMRMLNEAYEKAIALLRDHMETLDKVAEFLLEQETITGKEFMKIFHEVENKQDEVEDNQAVEAEMETVDTVEVETTEAEASESKTE
jgi:cell division protease FtsH